MEYHHCRNRHEPENGVYGDCLRACIASILSIEDPLTVPHFFEDTPDGEIAHARLKEYLLREHKLIPFYVGVQGETVEEALEFIGGDGNENVTYLLMGYNGENDHIVVCRGNTVEHDPAWIKRSLKGPCAQSGCFVAVFLVRADA